MLTLTVPSDERRVQVRSFWCLLSTVVAVLGLIVARWLHAPTFVTFLGVLFVMAAAPLVRPALVSRVYRAWNRRLVNPFANVAAKYVTKVTFLLVFIAVGKIAAPKNRRGPRSASTWSARGSLPSSAYAAPYAGHGSSPRGGRWIAEYVRWATRTGNLWSVSLLPYFLVLRLLSPGEETSVAENIYTLF